MPPVNPSANYLVEFFFISPQIYSFHDIFFTTNYDISLVVVHTGRFFIFIYSARHSIDLHAVRVTCGGRPHIVVVVHSLFDLRRSRIKFGASKKRSRIKFGVYKQKSLEPSARSGCGCGRGRSFGFARQSRAHASVSKTGVSVGISCNNNIVVTRLDDVIAKLYGWYRSIRRFLCSFSIATRRRRAHLHLYTARR